VTCGHGPTRLHVFKQKSNFFRPFLPENDFEMARKLIPRHKNTLLQLKKQYMAKFKTFSRPEHVFTWGKKKKKNRSSTAHILSRRYKNVVETNFEMTFVDEIYYSFCLIEQCLPYILFTPRSTRFLRFQTF